MHKRIIYILIACLCFAAVCTHAQSDSSSIRLILPHPYFVKPDRSFIGERYSLSYRKNKFGRYIVYAIFDNLKSDFVYSGIIYQPEDIVGYPELAINGGTLSDSVIDVFFSEYALQDEWKGHPDKVFKDRDLIVSEGTFIGEIIIQNRLDTSNKTVFQIPELYQILFDENYYARVSVSPARDRMALFADKRIVVYDLQTGKQVWRSRKVRSKNKNEFILANKQEIITSLPIKKQEYAHIIRYDFENDTVVFNSQKTILTTIVRIFQAYNHLVLQYGGAESKEPISASFINLATGKFSDIRRFKNDRRFNLAWYVHDSIAKPTLTDFDYKRYFENYTQYASWFHFYGMYYDYYNDPETGNLVHVKKMITPMTVNPEFFSENGFSNIDSVLTNYEIVSAFDNRVTYFDRSRDVRIYNIYAHNKEVLFWNGNQTLPSNRKVKLIVSAQGVPVFFTEDNYYYSSKEAKNFIAFLYRGKRYSFEQFDIKFNRPDIVLARLGYASQELINAYNQAYKKRITKMGFTEEQLSGEFHVPATEIESFEYMPQIEEDMGLQLNFNDTRFKLDRYNIWLNEVPVYGVNGKSLKTLQTDSFRVKETIHLSEGRNKIQVSCLNEVGAESFKETINVNYYSKLNEQVKLYFIGIGIDDFSEPGHNLKYSVKDIRDLTAALKLKYGKNLVVDTLFNEQVTVENVKALKNRLLQTGINDKVIISFSGHGLLSSTYDYYLATHTTNFKKPEEGGLPYENLEWLLDSIPARQKLLLIDACHSGEVDKEELLAMQNTNKTADVKGAELMYAYEPTLGMKNSFELMQELFSNLNRGTGATIISAAAGNQFAYEKGQLKNGVFTYSILELMSSKKEITVSELKAAVGKRVEELTNGLQKPTSRTENLENDWRVW